MSKRRKPLKTAQTASLSTASEKGVRKPLRHKVEQRPVPVELEMKKYSQAVDMAENPERPDRTFLYAFYRKALADAHLRSLVNTRKLKSLATPYTVQVGGRLHAKATELLDGPWFHDFCDHALDTLFWGHSLIELLPDEEGNPDRADVVPREHVRPDVGLVVMEPRDEKGIDYRSPKFWWVTELGKSNELGILKDAVPEVIWKRYSRGDWSQYSERFGQPIVGYHTSSRDDAELKSREAMLANMGANGYMIADVDEKLEFYQPEGSGNAYMIYKEKVEMCNRELSKLILGQTMTSEDGSSRSQAEVHERVMNEYIEADLRWLQRHVNKQLLPMLAEHYGMNELRDAKLVFDTEPVVETGHALSSHALSSQGHGAQGRRAQGPTLGMDDIYGPEGFKLPLAPTETLSAQGAHEGCCTLADDGWENTQASAFEQAFVQAAKRLHGGKPAEQLDETLWKLTDGMLNKALNKGLGKMAEVTDDSPEASMVAKMRDDLHVFSGFKTYQGLREATDLLRDKNGRVKGWPAFKQDVLKVNAKYNEQYLRAEYNHAVGSAQMSAKWQRFQQSADRYYLQYRTVGDSQVRVSHARLNRITLPMDDPFWAQYYPPNAWNCRCNVVQVPKEGNTPTDSETALQAGQQATTQIGKNGENKLEMFRFNPGMQGQVFPSHHPYYDAGGHESAIRRQADRFESLTKGLGLKLDEWGEAHLSRNHPQRKDVETVLSKLKRMKMPTTEGPFRILEHTGMGEGRFNERPRIKEISLRKDANALTVAHEIAHLIDWEILGKGKGMGTNYFFDNNPDGIDALPRSVALDKWDQVVNESKAVRALGEMLAGQREYKGVFLYEGHPYYHDVEIFLRPSELFARSLSQYIVGKNGKPYVLKDQEKLKEIQWDDDDFTGIKEAFDALVRELQDKAD